MAKRPTQTLVLITPRELMRADFGPGSAPKLLALTRQPRPDVDQFGLLVEMALLQGGKTGPRVWILSTDLWMHPLEVIVNIQGISRSEQIRALSLEAEQFSGISGLDSQVGFMPLPSANGMRTFLVSQIRDADLDDAEGIVRKAGGKLEGILHPAALPASLTTTGTGAWRRLEFWPDQTVAVQREASGQLRHMIVTGDPATGRWRGDYETFCLKQPEIPTEVLLATPSLSPDEGMPLEDDAVLPGWLTSWAGYLAGKERSVAYVAPPTRPMAESTRRVYMGLGVAVALLLCVGHYLWSEKSLAQLKGAIKKAEEPAARLKDLDETIKAKAKAREDEIKKLNKLQTMTENLRSQRTRIAQLLEACALHRHEGANLVIRKIDAESGEPRLYGECIDAKHASVYYKQVADSVQKFGWQASPMNISEHPERKILGGGPFFFDVRFNDAPAMVQRLVSAVGTKPRPAFERD